MVLYLCIIITMTAHLFMLVSNAISFRRRVLSNRHTLQLLIARPQFRLFRTILENPPGFLFLVSLL